MLAPHTHLIYIDEPSNMEVGKNMLLHGKAETCEYIDYEKQRCDVYRKMVGVPLIYSISFFLFGINNFVAINASVVFGSLSIVLIFLVGYLLFKKEEVGLYAAFLLSIFPQYVLWSGSAETHTISIFFVLLTLLFFLLHLETRNPKMFSLALTSLVYTLQTRGEYILLLPLLGIAIFIWDKEWKKTKNHKSWIFSIIFILFFVSFLYQFSRYYELNKRIAIEQFGKNSILDLETFKSNLIRYTSLLIKGIEYPVILNLFAIVGLFHSRKDRKPCLFLLMWFLCFFLSLMLFFRVQPRMLLVSGLGLILLMAYGIFSISERLNEHRFKWFLMIFLMLLITASAHPYLKEIMKGSEVMETETRIPELMEKQTDDCYVITEYPTILMSTTPIKSISTREVIKNPHLLPSILNKTCIYYFQDFFCVIPESAERCRKMHERYDLKEVISYGTADHIDFVLYKVSTQ